jgi:3-oxoacyl-[acyl-carrier protein] reductase
MAPGSTSSSTNAGFIGGTQSVEELDPADWRRIVDVNLTGVFEVSRRSCR